MSKLDERETRRRKSFVQSVIDQEVKNEPTQEKTEEVLKLKQRAYYLTDDLLKAITIKTAESELDKSGVVREALKLYLADILKNI
ncbi:MAG: hypothetical protein RR620_12560 [Clostridium sp.]|uniref:hypothetical protein n=1 Tax=Anaerorhabdus sp. TaxID=1872524 RepID=UPI002FC93DB4